MQSVHRKQKKHGRHTRLLALCAALVLLIGAGGFTVWQAAQKPTVTMVSPDSYGEVITRTEDDVAALAITLRSGEHWAIHRENGAFVMEDEPDFPMDESMLRLLLNAASVVSYSDILTENKEDYAEHLEVFGLDTPRAIAAITYTDGQQAVLHIGDKCRDSETNYYYMTLEGDDRLFALDSTTAGSLITEKRLLHAVVQPVIHKARLDAISLIRSNGETLSWMLDGSIEAADAADRWLLVQPVRYPADGVAMDNLRENLANMRLGVYVGEATPENMVRCGLDTPRFTIQLHMAAGSVGLVSESGVYNVSDWPESSFTMHVGGSYNEVTDYVQVGGGIYLENHFTMGALMGMTAASTLTPYPVLTSFSNLLTLSVTTESGTVTYELNRSVALDEDEKPLEDENGAAIPVNTATRNGEPISYDAFEAAYQRLMMATVGGELPADWTPTDIPHTLYTFQTVTGVTHTIGLTRYDALHDAVLVDGCAMFYIIRGGLDFNVEPAA